MLHSFKNFKLLFPCTYSSWSDDYLFIKNIVKLILLKYAFFPYRWGSNVESHFYVTIIVFLVLLLISDFDDFLDDSPLFDANRSAS